MPEHVAEQCEPSRDHLCVPIIGACEFGNDPILQTYAQKAYVDSYDVDQKAIDDEDLAGTLSRLSTLQERRTRLEARIAQGGVVSGFAARVALVVTGEQQSFHRGNLLRIFQNRLPGISFSPEKEERLDQ